MREQIHLTVSTVPRCRSGSNDVASSTAALRVRAQNLQVRERTPASLERQKYHRGHRATESAAPRPTICTWLAAICTLIVSILRNRSASTSDTTLHDALLYDRDMLYGGPRTAHLAIEIFAAPKPFVGQDADHQVAAIESWLMLKPRPTITLLGRTQGSESIVRRYGLNWLPDIDTTFLGVPLFNAIFAAANASSADIVVIANADIFVFDDFTYALRKIYRDVPGPWLAVGARWDLGNSSSNLLQNHGGRFHGLARRRQAIVSYARENGTLHTYGGIDVWAWNTKSGESVYDGFLPHFVFGRGKYDNWFTHEVIAAGRRTVIDVSEACTLVHVAHDHHLVSEQMEGGNEPYDVPMAAASKRSFWNDGARVKFELYINTYLAAAHGSYANQMGTLLHASYKLHSCYESEAICLFRRRRPHACRCEHSPFVHRAMTDPFAVNHSYLVFCGLLSTDQQRRLFSGGDTHNRFAISGRVEKQDASRPDLTRSGSSLDDLVTEAADSSDDLRHWTRDAVYTSRRSKTRGATAFGLPMILERLVEIIEHRTGSKQVMLAVLNFNHKRLLMNLVCSARRTNVFPRLVIAALDDDMYHFAITRGLAVYLEQGVYVGEYEDEVASGIGYGSVVSDLRVTARLRIVQRLLQLDRDVLYVDTDVVLIRDPLVDMETSIAVGLDVAFLSRRPIMVDAARNVPGKARGDGRAPPYGVFATGVFYARANNRTNRLFANLIGRVQSLSRYDRGGDVKMLDDLVEDEACGESNSADGMDNGGGSGGKHESTEICVSSGDARVGLLPASMFVDHQVLAQARPLETLTPRTVLLHLGGAASVVDKVASVRQILGLDLFDDTNEVCRSFSFKS